MRRAPAATRSAAVAIARLVAAAGARATIAARVALMTTAAHAGDPEAVAAMGTATIAVRVVAAVARAAPTLLAAAGAVDGEAPLDWWRRAFSLTYSVELRAERSGRAQSVVDADAARYDRFSLPAMAAIPAGAASGGWARRRIEGKLLGIVRLAKASLTYAGGIDYLAWKINRHAGTKIEIKPWQRRWPLVAALTLVPRLVKSGAIR